MAFENSDSLKNVKIFIFCPAKAAASASKTHLLKMFIFS